MRAFIIIPIFTTFASADIFDQAEAKLSEGSLSRSDSALSCEDPEKFQAKAEKIFNFD